MGKHTEPKRRGRKREAGEQAMMCSQEARSVEIAGRRRASAEERGDSTGEKESGRWALLSAAEQRAALPQPDQQFLIHFKANSPLSCTGNENKVSSFSFSLRPSVCFSAVVATLAIACVPVSGKVPETE